LSPFLFLRFFLFQFSNFFFFKHGNTGSPPPLLTQTLRLFFSLAYPPFTVTPSPEKDVTLCRGFFSLSDRFTRFLSAYGFSFRGRFFSGKRDFFFYSRHPLFSVRISGFPPQKNEHFFEQASPRWKNPGPFTPTPFLLPVVEALPFLFSFFFSLFQLTMLRPPFIIPSKIIFLSFSPP